MNLELLSSYAMSFLGTPYKYGGRSSLEGLDCSQYVIELLIAAGVFPHGFDTTAQGVYTLLIEKGCSNTPGTGALAFYGRNSMKISHVAFCLDEKTMLEAGGGDPKVTTLEIATEKSALIRMRPIKYRADYLGLVMPIYSV
jgi:cell wall-associated NlpC family hydrolase